MGERRQLTAEEYAALKIPVPLGKYLSSGHIKPASRYRLYNTFTTTPLYSNKRLEDVRKELKGTVLTAGPFTINFAGIGVRIKRGVETVKTYTWCSIVQYIADLLDAGAWISDAEKTMGIAAIEKAAAEKEAGRWSIGKTT